MSTRVIATYKGTAQNLTYPKKEKKNLKNQEYEMHLV